MADVCFFDRNLKKVGLHFPADVFLALFYRESDFGASKITDLECLRKCSETKISQDQAYVTHFPRIFEHYNASQVLHIECLIHAHVFMSEACPQN